MTKHTRLSAALSTSRVEKDVENAYRAEVAARRDDAEWSSPHGTDGVAEWSAGTPPRNVRLLLEAKYDLDFKQRGHVCSVLGQLILYLKRFESAGGAMPNVLLVGIVLFLLGSPVASGLLWGGASNAENAKLSKTLEAIADHLDELDARMTRLERAAKAAKETKP